METLKISTLSCLSLLRLGCSALKDLNYGLKLCNLLAQCHSRTSKLFSRLPWPRHH